MKYSDQSYNLRIELDTKDCDFSPEELGQIEEDLDSLAKAVESFPVSDLYVTIIHHPRSNSFHVKTSLRLPSVTLFTGDRDEQMHPAYIRCVRKLVKKVEAYKSDLASSEEISKREKRTRQSLEPERIPNAELLEQAVDEADYAAFRREMMVYEDSLSKRIGRWVQRYPLLDSQIGERIVLADLVEEVFLNAFELYGERGQDVTLGDWLEHLIDPSVKHLVNNPDDELENIGFARALFRDDFEAGEGDPRRSLQPEV